METKCTCDGPGGCPARGVVVDAASFKTCQNGDPVVTCSKACIYLGREDAGKHTKDNRQIYDCQIHEKCTIRGLNDEVASCEKCEQRLFRDDPDMGRVYRDLLTMVDRYGTSTESMRGVLAGRPAFLAGGGPSANEHPLEFLNSRGTYTMCINNMAAHPRFRPQAFVCADPPSKFHSNIWLDPAIDKFIPVPKLTKRGRGKLRRKVGDEFEELTDERGENLRTVDVPNVWGFQRGTWMAPDDTFFLNDSAPWGNQNAGVLRTGEKKTVCTMLLGIRLLYYLGARRIYLLGVDFQMSPAHGYAFAQARTKDASASNNEHFATVNDWLCRMVKNGVFDRFGLSIYNCNERSGLRAFPHVPFATALADVRRGIDDEVDLSFWYEKFPKK